MQAIRAVYDGISFKPKQDIPVQGHYDVVITFLEPIALDKKTDKIRPDEKYTKIDWLNKIEADLELTDDEDLSNFPSTGFTIDEHMMIFMA